MDFGGADCVGLPDGRVSYIRRGDFQMGAQVVVPIGTRRDSIIDRPSDRSLPIRHPSFAGQPFGDPEISPSLLQCLLYRDPSRGKSRRTRIPESLHGRVFPNRRRVFNFAPSHRCAPSHGGGENGATHRGDQFDRARHYLSHRAHLVVASARPDLCSSMEARTGAGLAQCVGTRGPGTIDSHGDNWNLFYVEQTYFYPTRKAARRSLTDRESRRGCSGSRDKSAYRFGGSASATDISRYPDYGDTAVKSSPKPSRILPRYGWKQFARLHESVHGGGNIENGWFRSGTGGLVAE